jgi:hypothetical protein
LARRAAAAAAGQALVVEGVALLGLGADIMAGAAAFATGLLVCVGLAWALPSNWSRGVVAPVGWAGGVAAAGAVWW